MCWHIKSQFFGMWHFFGFNCNWNKILAFIPKNTVCLGPWPLWWRISSCHGRRGSPAPPSSGYHSGSACPAIPTPSLVRLPGHKNTLADKKRTSHSGLACPAILTPSLERLPGHKNTLAAKKRTIHSGSACPAILTPSLVRLPGHKNTLAAKKRTNRQSCVSWPAAILKLSPASQLDTRILYRPKREPVMIT